MAHTPASELTARALPFSLDDEAAFGTSVDHLIASMPATLSVLAVGEAMHGDELILQIRNRLFERLVRKHGFTAIAIESSFPRGRLVNDFVHGRGGASYDDVVERGFSHGFGKLAMTQALIEWIRQYNAQHAASLDFFGFDAPTEMMHTDSPRALLQVPIKFLSRLEDVRSLRARIDELLGDDAAWENPAANMDASKSIGNTPSAIALRLETESLIAMLETRRPELIDASDLAAYLDAVHCARSARHLLTYHAGVAGSSPTRIADLLALRDWMMSENVEHVLAMQRARGVKSPRLFVFAHNGHVRLGQMKWQLGPHALTWWPAGAQLRSRLGQQYAVIGSGVGSSADNGLSSPEPGTLEQLLLALPGPNRFVPLSGLDASAHAEGATLAARSQAMNNSTYFPLGTTGLSDFDALLMMDETTSARV